MASTEDNVRCEDSFELEDLEESFDELVISDEIIAMKRQIQASEETMRQIWVQVMEGLQESELLTLVAQYAQEARERDRYVAELINLYETELKKLSLSTDNLLNDKQKQVLQDEIHQLTSHSVENFRHGDIASRHLLLEWLPYFQGTKILQHMRDTQVTFFARSTVSRLICHEIFFSVHGSFFISFSIF
ncbi:uncharacterized protein [Montipora foliosa]|uniref:uncharacterized protein n=1 Tax=Montipora foliosa TaxID=591990 RepID=UPI0035F19A0E